MGGPGERDEAAQAAWRAEAAPTRAEELVFPEETGGHLSRTPTHAWAAFAVITPAAGEFDLSDGRPYFLSPRIRRFRHSGSRPQPKGSSERRCPSADALAVSTVWNGRATRSGATRRPCLSYLPSPISSVIRPVVLPRRSFRIARG